MQTILDKNNFSKNMAHFMSHNMYNILRKLFNVYFKELVYYMK